MTMLKTFVRRKVYLSILGGLALCFGIAAYITLCTFSRDDATLPVVSNGTVQKLAENRPEKVTAQLPVRLKIPKIKVDTTLEHVGLTPEGQMEVPKSPDNAAWFKLGPRPGERGSSVIDGHFGLKDKKPAIFDDLHLLKKGDSLYIEDEKGATITFVVQELRMFKPNEDASSVFASNDGKAHLNIITCRGVWDKARQSYSTRLVVFADRTM